MKLKDPIRKDYYTLLRGAIIGFVFGFLFGAVIILIIIFAAGGCIPINQ